MNDSVLCEHHGLRTVRSPDISGVAESGACDAAAGSATGLRCACCGSSISIETEQTFAQPLTPLFLTMIYTDTDSGKTPIKSADRDEAPPQEQVSQY